VATDRAGYRLYEDLAAWWPLISPPEEYAEEAAFAGRLLRRADRPVREVLELGSGGGHCASHLAPGFTMTLVDLSAGMLAVSRRLNPECEHVEADMRTLRLGRDFDAVFVHDAVDYMTTEEDLRLVIETAFTHCRPGGVAVFVPDNITENFEPGTGYGGIDGADGRGRGTWTGPTTRTRATPGPSPSTRSCSGSPAARSGWCTRRTGSACLAGTPGSGCCARPVSGRRW